MKILSTKEWPGNGPSVGEWGASCGSITYEVSGLRHVRVPSIDITWKACV